MIVPGSNLLHMAMGVIGAQEVQWAKFLGKTTNAAGIDVPAFEAPTTVYGSFQAVDQNLLQNLGLDWTKNYATFYASADFGDVNRDKTGDRLVYGGTTYSILSKTPWFKQDGWTRVLCVEIEV